jgi:ribosomal-protein-alanine N-acetyltransferase
MKNAGKEGAKKMENEKTIITERLLLRRFSEDDAEEVFAIAKDPDVGPRAGWHPHADVEETLSVLREIIMPSDAFAVTLKDSGKIIGNISIENDRYRPDANSGELGYWLGKEYWGNGYMTEAARAVIDYAFGEKGLSMLGICTSPVNARSQGVIKKCGFVYEGTIRRTFKTFDGTLRDSRVYSMTKEEYEALRG